MKKYRYIYKIDLLNNEVFLFDGTLNLYPNESCVITGSQQLIKTINKKSPDYNFFNNRGFFTVGKFRLSGLQIMLYAE